MAVSLCSRKGIRSQQNKFNEIVHFELGGGVKTKKKTKQT